MSGKENNEADMDVYTHPALRAALKIAILEGDKGGAAGQWSARKAQRLALEYKRHGGGYRGSRSRSQRSLTRWTREKWRTRSGRPSTQGALATGERYLPEAAIKALTRAQYDATTRVKRAGIRRHQQFVPNTARARQASRAARRKF